MGNYISNQKNKLCLICQENINTNTYEWCECIKCNIALHNFCEENYRANKKYTECPNCHKIGTIGCFNIKQQLD
jgi:hypothetical protein